MDRARVSAVGLFCLWVLFLFLSCSVYGDWWPLFNLIFIVLGFMPFVFGSHHSGGLWGATGDFVAGSMAVSLFAFPMVLYNAYAIGPQALILVFVSNVFFLASLYIGVNYVSY